MTAKERNKALYQYSKDSRSYRGKQTFRTRGRYGGGYHKKREEQKGKSSTHDEGTKKDFFVDVNVIVNSYY